MPWAIQTISPKRPYILQYQNWTLRLELIRAKLVNANLQEQTTQSIMHHKKLTPTVTNKTYHNNQLCLLDWAYKNHVSYTDTGFSGVDIVNFLTSIRQTHNLQVPALNIVRATTHSLASSRALDQGIPIEDIVPLGN
ncbi:hypothetical protein INT46_008033 [Mucor plumbeus]|uniref:Uncharacterized protein n=1 Tax=Mucor plumbeus TaxID=97098 RepID=A0A8H7QW97_9FUNG|nr:hypothetical protein INT46_008033 [Mucor plumbeus]